jgi:hypothetical protein
MHHEPPGADASDRRDGSARDGSARQGSGREGTRPEQPGADGSDRHGGIGDNGTGREQPGADGSDHRDGTAQDGTAQDGTAQDGTAQDGTAQDGTAHDATGRGDAARKQPGSDANDRHGRGAEGDEDEGDEEQHAMAGAVADALREQLTELTDGLRRDSRRCRSALVDEAVGRMKAALAELNSRWCTTTIGQGGHIVRHGADSYRVPAGMRRMLDARDGTCRFPGCRRHAARCDADHTEPFHKGGATCLCNLANLCRRHHRLKQRPEWRLVQIWPGVLVWIAPTGHWYIIS